LRAVSARDDEYGLEDEPDWRSVRWPERLRAMTVDGRRVHVATLGGGDRRSLLLVHGLGGRWQTWLANLPALAQRRRVAALDLPGFGRSQMPVGAVSIEGYARVLERVCDLLELEAPLVAGHGLGALAAAELARRDPRSIGGLALVGLAARGPGRLLASGATFSSGLGSRLGDAQRLLARPRARRLALAAAIRHPSRIAPDLLRELSGGVQAPGAGGALAALASSEVGAVSLPTLVVAGAQDLLAPCGESRRLAASIAGARFESVADCGHMPMVEHPRRFNALLAGFADEL
jgi:pimeloyl-ACP methyl ester carboxylesterase